MAAAVAKLPNTRRESVRLIFGYVVWGLTGVVIAVPEIWAAVDADHVPWPTISGTVGYLEYWHSWIALIVVAVLVWAAFRALFYLTDGRERGTRTPDGRLTLRPEPRTRPLRVGLAIAYYATALGCVIAGPLIVLGIRPHDKFLLGEVLYGLIGLFGIVIPSAVALVYGADIPFAPLSKTIQDLEQRVRPVAFIVAAGLTIMLVHLALYPWPAVIADLQDIHKQNQQQRHAELKRHEPSPYAP